MFLSRSHNVSITMDAEEACDGFEITVNLGAFMVGFGVMLCMLVIFEGKKKMTTM